MTSAAPGAVLNQVPVDMDLKDVLDQLKKDIFLNMNCHHVGTVQSFDSSNQTAQITINYPQVFFQLNQLTGQYSPVAVPYPLLVNCPVMFLGGGTTSLTFPVSPGDGCLVLFNDRDMDNWLEFGSTNTACNTPRTHSFSDGIALVGLRPSAQALSNFSSTHATLQNGTTMVGVGASTIKIANAGTTLNTLLQDLATLLENLCTEINAIVTTNCVVGSPVALSPASIAAISAVSSSISSLATEIGDLLE